MIGSGQNNPGSSPSKFPMSVGFTPLQFAPAGGNDIKYTMNLKSGSEEAKWAMGINGGMQAVNSALNAYITYCNTQLQGKALDAQAEIAKKYYGAQEKIAGYQQTVALRQLDVQETAIYVQQDMHRLQATHEEKMMRLEGATQVRLARVAESGKNERARILSTQDVFSRRGHFMGDPMYS